MKAITLTQPYATLLTIGRKGWETRSWGTRYRGPMGIHAGRSMPAAERLFAQELALRWGDWRLLPDGSLPLGMMLAIAELVNVLRTEDALAAGLISDEERELGDYSPGRYCWEFRGQRPLPMPILARGSLGLWNWEGDR